MPPFIQICVPFHLISCISVDQNSFYARYKPVGKSRVCLYSLANMSDTGEFDIENMRAVRTRGVTFFTRPAINRTPGAVFTEMVDAARAFASRIKGEVIDFYDKGGQANPQLDEEMFPLKLTAREKADLVVFLREGLSSKDYPAVAPPKLPE